MIEKRKILIVEDNENQRLSLVSLLNNLYEVTQSANGKDAKILITLKKFDLILSDVLMPFCTGIELLEWVKEKFPTKFILMTGFTHILETKKAAELGAIDFLTKPFAATELLTIVAEHINIVKPVFIGPQFGISLDSVFCKVPIEDFVSEKGFQFDVFLRINNSKYVKIAHQGGKVRQEQVQQYKDKGITYLYIRKGDFGKLVGFTVALSQEVSKSKTLELEKKEHFAIYTGEMIVQHTFVNGLNDSSYKAAKDFVINSVNMIFEDPQIFSVLNMLNDHTNHLYAHSLAVSTFSVMIGHARGWVGTSTSFKLSMAGLLHDIGKKEIPKEILMKSRFELTQKERELIESHTERGKKILESLKQMPTEVVDVAYEHHENILRTGYPRRIPRLRIHPLTHIITVANIFANYVVKNPTFPNPVDSVEAIRLMERDHINVIDKASFEALKLVIADSNNIGESKHD